MQNDPNKHLFRTWFQRWNQVRASWFLQNRKSLDYFLFLWWSPHTYELISNIANESFLSVYTGRPKPVQRCRVQWGRGPRGIYRLMHKVGLCPITHQSATSYSADISITTNTTSNRSCAVLALVANCQNLASPLQSAAGAMFVISAVFEAAIPPFRTVNVAS